jgi:hypothetical protein
VDSYIDPKAVAARRAFIDIRFQEGPVSEVGVNGCHIEDVIDVLVERLRGFNEGPLRCRENSLAITALEEASNWLVRRRLNRLAQGVEGTMLPHK